MTAVKTLFFVRHGKLKLPYKDHSEMPFNMLADLASGRINPPIDKNFTFPMIKQLAEKIPLDKIKKIYHSPSKRCLETAKLIVNFISRKFSKKIPAAEMPELAEISFNLNKICRHLIQKQFDIEQINNKVFKAMISGENCEQVLGSCKRVKKIFYTIKRGEKKQDLLFITHDFLMRLIEIFIKKHGKIEPPIAFSELKNTKRNLYLHGFATDYSLSEFSPF